MTGLAACLFMAAAGYLVVTGDVLTACASSAFAGFFTAVALITPEKNQ